jgi:hypothetical protein
MRVSLTALHEPGYRFAHPGYEKVAGAGFQGGPVGLAFELEQFATAAHKLRRAVVAARPPDSS